MTCRYIRRHLYSFLDASLPSADMERIRQHMRSCRPCALLLEQEGILATELQSIADERLAKHPLLPLETFEWVHARERGDARRGLFSLVFQPLYLALAAFGIGFFLLMVQPGWLKTDGSPHPAAKAADPEWRWRIAVSDESDVVDHTVIVSRIDGVSTQVEVSIEYE